MCTVSGVVCVRLDDGRELDLHHEDLLEVLADLAQRRAVSDDGGSLVLDPLTPSDRPEHVVLQVRLLRSGDEVGTRHTSGRRLDQALREAWAVLLTHARDTADDGLADELLIPHTEHYAVGLA